MKLEILKTLKQKNWFKNTSYILEVSLFYLFYLVP